MNNNGFVIRNKLITTPISKIVKQIKSELVNGKLKDIHIRHNEIRCTCPFHKRGMEENPSCNIYTGEDKEDLKTGQFHCFTCGAKGYFDYFVAGCFDEKIEFGREWLCERYGDTFVVKDLNLPPIDLNMINNKNTDNKFNSQLTENMLNEFQSWHPYLETRKLTKEVCEKFEIKYDPKTQCIVFPVRDEKGKLKLLTRRSVNSKKFIIDKDIDKPVYLLHYLIKNNIKEAYVCESQFNSLTLWTHGLPGIALFGTGTTNQYKILNNSPIRTYHLLFDGDDAGDKAIDRFLQNIRKDVIVNIYHLPRGKDVNDLSYEELEALICNNYK